jgi:hypothetical protein
VDGCWSEVWFWSEVWSKPSLGCRCWLTLPGGIVRVVFELRTWWVPNVGIKIAKGCLILNTRKCEGINHSMGRNKCTGFLPWGNFEVVYL